MNLQFSMMTPHQFESVREFVDTILVSTFAPFALDIAVPFVASEMISNGIVDGVSNKFRGRATTLRAGSISLHAGLTEEWAEPLAEAWMHPVRYGLVITDRVLVNDACSFSTKEGRQWVIFDWWQWLRRRVPANRLSDAYMFLCHACPPYWESPERKLLGIDAGVSQSMREEGARLLEALISTAVDTVLKMWTPNADSVFDGGVTDSSRKPEEDPEFAG